MGFTLRLEVRQVRVTCTRNAVLLTMLLLTMVGLLGLCSGATRTKTESRGSWCGSV